MLHVIWNAGTRVRSILRGYTPTNWLLDYLGRRDRLMWGLPAMLLAVPYLLAASTCAQIVADGGPGWVNMLVLLFIWNAFKFIVNGPASTVRLINARERAKPSRIAECVRSEAELAEYPQSPPASSADVIAVAPARGKEHR